MGTRLLLTTLSAVLAIPNCLGADQKAVLWQAPGDITIRDWIWGSGGEARAPKPPYQFVSEDPKGTNPKIRVRDANDNQWIVKFGRENHSDVFGSRLLHATGYVTEASYFVAGGVITGAHDLKRAKPFLSKDGAFSYARFKLRDRKALAHVDGPTWSWTDNPFVGTQELNGLKILLMLASNWDAKDARDGEGSNTAIYSKPGSPETRYYAFDDWGATMGKWGGFFARDKWNPVGYQKQTKDFARVTASQTIEWGYRGKHYKDVTSGITVADVKWLLAALSRVTDEQLRAGLRASGAREPDIDMFARSIRDRISQLQKLVAPPATAVGLAAAYR